MWAAVIENSFLEFPEGLGVFKVTMRGLAVTERDRKLCGRKSKQSFDKCAVRGAQSRQKSFPQEGTGGFD